MTQGNQINKRQNVFTKDRIDRIILEQTYNFKICALIHAMNLYIGKKINPQSNDKNIYLTINTGFFLTQTLSVILIT